ncbi:hypothetical protein [Chamaesiphon sp. OTE_75_metabat_556]|uniref:hypothetical protein n=1 Tax=Chamaesiphon sp. OTE_75_metabat_556 TaxID=2964692 RepID=UPI00286A8634|nr:hypothetical protein [Chamaesiphon sp. OTE_75_metabat_556]
MPTKNKCFIIYTSHEIALNLQPLGDYIDRHHTSISTTSTEFTRPDAPKLTLGIDLCGVDRVEMS